MCTKTHFKKSGPNGLISVYQYPMSLCRKFKRFWHLRQFQRILIGVLTWPPHILNYSTYTQLENNILYFLYQCEDPNNRELFSNCKLLHVEKKYWKYSIFDTEYSHLSNNKSIKVSPSFGSHYWYKKLKYIIFQLSITHFSEQFQNSKKKYSHRWPC